jgi:ankyrin repeat protein
MDDTTTTPLQIFITDDSKAYTLRLTTLIQKAAAAVNRNVNILNTDDPKQAIDIITSHNFDIVFVDDVFCNSSLSGRYILQSVTACQENNTAQHILISGRKLMRQVKSSTTTCLNVKEISKRDLNYTFICKLIAASSSSSVPTTSSSRVSKSGIDINKVEAKGEHILAALLVAAATGNSSVCKLLLSTKNNGVDINVTTDSGATPLYFAAQEGHINIVRLLLSQNEIDVNAATDSGATPLFISSQEGHVEVVELLLATNDIDINNAENNNNGWTALHIAAETGHIEVVRLLVSKAGIDINRASRDFGFTALYVAAEKGRVEIVRILLSTNGIDMNITTKDESTALYIASENGHGEIVRLILLERGSLIMAGC